MNKVVLMGRLTRDPEVRYSQGENALAIARYTLAVDRRFKRLFLYGISGNFWKALQDAGWHQPKKKESFTENASL